MRSFHLQLLAALLILVVAAWGEVVGSVRGVVHDPQRRPLQNAMVMIHAKASDWAATIHLSYSNQVARAGGFVNGGLTDFSSLAWAPLDHDQRNTLNIGGDLSLPYRVYASTNVYYGSGFSNAFPNAPFPTRLSPAIIFPAIQRLI